MGAWTRRSHGIMQEDRRDLAAQEQRGTAEAANMGLTGQLTPAASVHREVTIWQTLACP